MTGPRITIGMPVHDGADHVEVAIRSLLSQAERDFTLLISDNCSTDGTAEICKALASEDSRIVLVEQPTNIGAIHNFEFVLREARTPFFMWAGGDDTWDPAFLTVTMKALSESPDAIGCVPGLKVLDSEMREMGNVLPPKGLGSKDRLTRARAVRHSGWCAMCGLFRREALLAQEIPDVAAADSVLVMELALAGRFVLCPKVLWTWRKMGYNLTPGPDGRLQRRKALDPDGRMYKVDPKATCRSMRRAVRKSGVSGVEKFLLMVHLERVKFNGNRGWKVSRLLWHVESARARGRNVRAWAMAFLIFCLTPARAIGLLLGRRTLEREGRGS